MIIWLICAVINGLFCIGGMLSTDRKVGLWPDAALTFALVILGPFGTLIALIAMTCVIINKRKKGVR